MKQLVEQMGFLHKFSPVCTIISHGQLTIACNTLYASSNVIVPVVS